MNHNDPGAASFKSAVESADADEIRRLFDAHPELEQVIDKPWFAFGSTALVLSTLTENRAVIDALLDLGADVDAKSDWSAGPYGVLDCVVDKPAPVDIELADHLIARGATLDIHAAAGLGRMDVLTELLDANPERVSEPGPDGATPLHLAMNIEVAQFLLDRGAELDKRCVDHNSTAAMWSVAGREDVTRFLLDRGARADLFMAAALDDVALAERLLETEPGAIDVRVRFGESNDHLGQGDKYVWALDFAQTPAEVARRRGNEAIYALLLGRSSPFVNLLHASRRGDVDLLASMLRDDPDLLATLTDGQTREALSGTADAAHILLEQGANPNAIGDENGATALHVAAWEGARDRIEVLLAHGADRTIVDRTHSGTPAGWADAGGHEDLVELLR
jgi:ankyrin repeat protein